ncbi:MAG: DsbA family protein [Meiothermus sp.]|nr:DsbA family protein [Meiothermus sp.]
MSTVTVYFDYLCPFAWRGLELLNVVAPLEGFDLELRHFSLVQGNHADNANLPRSAPAWKLAEQPMEALRGDPSPFRYGGMMAFLASHAAAQQGKAAHLSFALELFRLRHREKAELHEPSTLILAAERAGLGVGRFQDDLAEEAARRGELAKDLEQAGELAVFGTPTIQLPGGQAAYLRFANLTTEPEAALRLWGQFVGVLESGAHIETIKRPRR